MHTPFAPIFCVALFFLTNDESRPTSSTPTFIPNHAAPRGLAQLKNERAEGERGTLRSNHGRAAALPRITSLPMSLLLRTRTHAHIYRHAFVKSAVPVEMQLNSAMVHSGDEHALNCIGMSRALRQRPSERTAAHNRPAYVPHARGSLRAD